MGAPLRLVFDPAGAVLASARDCEAEVFLRWFGNTREQLAQEYEPYEDATVFVAVADEQDHVLAAVRLLAPGGRNGFKTLVDVGAAPWNVDGERSARAAGIDLATTWEVATLGVRTGVVGGTRLALVLYHALMTVAHENAMSTFVAVLDVRVQRLLASVGIVTHPLPGTGVASYLGSAASVPVYCHYAPMRDNQRRDLPDACRLVTLGIGLDGVQVPPPEAFRLRPRPTTIGLADAERGLVVTGSAGELLAST